MRFGRQRRGGFGSLEDLQCTAAFMQETGLLLSLVGAEMITEDKTYTKEIIKKSDVGKNDQVMVYMKGDKLVAQYFCNAGICRSESDTVGQLIVQSGKLVLIMQNINPSDRFYALHNLKIILQNFTLDEDEDPILNPSITQTVPPTFTTPSPAEEAPYQRHLEQPNMTDTTGILIKVGVGVGVVLALAVAVAVVIDLKSGRDGRIARAIAFFRRRSCDSVPKQHDDDSTEMQSLAAPVYVDMGHLKSVQCAQNCME